jgi:hypothetical protein
MPDEPSDAELLELERTMSAAQTTVPTRHGARCGTLMMQSTGSQDPDELLDALEGELAHELNTVDLVSQVLLRGELNSPQLPCPQLEAALARIALSRRYQHGGGWRGGRPTMQEPE